MAYFKITQDKKGRQQAKIQVSGKDIKTGKNKLYVKRVYGVYEKLWQLSSMFVLKGFNILEASDSSKFIDVNIPTIEPNVDKLYLRACMIGKPDVFIQTIDNRRVKIVQVENRMYIPDKTVSV